MLSKLKQQLALGKNLIIFTTLRGVGGMLFPLLVAKFFSEDLLGSYGLARMIIFFVATLTISSAQTPFIVHANEERDKTGKINKSFSVQCIFLVISLFLFFFIVTLFAGPVSAFAKIAKSDLVFVTLAFIGFVGQLFLCNLFMALGQRTKSAFIGVVYNFLTVLFVIAFWFFDNINLRSVFLTYFLSSVLLVLFFVGTLDFKVLLPLYFDSGYFKKMLHFTFWVILGSTSIYFINWGNNIVLRIFVSIKEIGIYLFAFTIYKGLTFSVSAIGQYFLPFISRNINDKDKLRNYLAVKRPKIIAVGLAGLVLVFFFFPYMRQLIYGDKFSLADPIVRCLLLGNVINLYTVFYGALFNAFKKYKFLNITAVVQIVISVILSFILIPRMGLMGAAIATVIAYFCKAVLLEIYFRLYIKSRLK